MAKDTTRIKGKLLFQRVGQGMITFKAAAPQIASNQIVQIAGGLLPDDYAPEKYEITGEFLYSVTVKERAVE